jgi:hypothetical protein
MPGASTLGSVYPGAYVPFAVPPATPQAISPANAATGVFTPTLTWSAAGASSYDVYFGTNPAPPLVSSGQTSASYAPTVADGVTYYWKIVAINPVGSTTGAIWSFTTGRATGLVMTIGGLTPRTRVSGLTIQDVLNDAPNTCRFIVDTTAPTVGQDVQIALGSLTAGNLIFAGTIVGVEQFYEGEKAANLAWRVTCQDYTHRLNRRKVRKRYGQQGATAIASDLLTNYTSGFTAGQIAGGLPTVTGGIDFTDEEVLTCLTRLAARIGGYADVDYSKDVRLFLTDAASAPDPLNATTPPLADPPVTREEDITPRRTRTYVEGGGANATASVGPSIPQIPIGDVSWYNPAGGVVVSGPQRITYTGVAAGGAGALVGTTVTPTNGPTVTRRATTGLSTGTYGYEATFTTGSGETKPGPVTSVVLGGAVPAPVSAPTAAKTFGGNLSVGVYQWKVAFVTAGGETLASAASASVTMDDIAAPTAIGTASESTSDSTDSYSYKFTFTNGTVETLPSPASNTILAGSAANFWNAAAKLTRAGNSTPLAGWNRRFYRTAASGATYKRMGGPSEGFWSDDGSYYYDSETAGVGDDASLGANAPTTSTAIYRSASLTSIPISPDPFVTKRRIYRTAANGSTFKVVADINDNTTTTYTDTLADASLGATELGTATALYLATDLTNIPIGPSGTTGRKVYRTVANGSTYKLLTTIANNTTTTFTDTTADASLGATAPTSDTSGLVAQSGEVAAGSPSILVTSTAPFQAAGGWAFIGALAIRYTALTADSLTGVPISGYGSLGTTVRYGSEVVAAPMITGIPLSPPGAILYDILAGDPVNIWVQRDDLAAQAAVAALEGGDGIYEHVIQDRRLGLAEAAAVGDADLAIFSRPITTIRYATHDRKTRSGKTIHIDLPSLGILGDFIIQAVTIDQIDIAPGRYPRYTVEASSVRFSFEDVLRRLRLVT